MNSQLPTLTIGIPAYNEEANIKTILESIFQQEKNQYLLQKIIISSDNSTDNTVKIAKSFDRRLITIIDNKERKGQSRGQNQIISHTNTDILVLLNADIGINDINFIWKLISPITQEGIDLTSSNISFLTPSTIFGKMLVYSHNFRNHFFENYNQGQNIYTCHGAARAFSKRFYKSLRFKYSTAEDAYSYLKCISSEKRYKYCPNASVFIKSPESLKDHQNQSIRFFQSKQILSKTFSRTIVNSEYKLPTHKIVKIVIKYLYKNPTFLFIYSLVFLYSFIISHFSKPTNTWKISNSSKQLI